MKFGNIIEKIKNGKIRAMRKAWQGKNLFIYMEIGRTIPAIKLREPQKGWLGGKDLKTSPHIVLMNNGTVIPGYVVPMADLMADDWELIIPCLVCRLNPITVSDPAGYKDLVCGKCKKEGKSVLPKPAKLGRAAK
jgi:hypothetical protein